MEPWLERFRTYAATFEGAHEEFPWGHETPVFKNAKQKIFAMTGYGDDGTFRVTVKLSPEDGDAALSLPFVTRAAYVGRYGWVSVVVDEEAKWDLVVDWVSQSYALVTPKKRAKKATT